MADFKLRNNVSRISPQSINPDTPVGKVVDEKWLASDIDIVLSNSLRTAPIIIDFSYSVSSVIEYTLRGDASGIYIPFESDAIAGGQSRFIRVTDGDKLNFRAKQAGDLNRAIIGEP